MQALLPRKGRGGRARRTRGRHRSCTAFPAPSDVTAEIADRLAAAAAADDAADELWNLSNATVDLVHEGKLDEAERAARDLLERFPDVHDGWDRLGMVYEARGDHRQAADCYRKVIDVIRANPDDYDPGFEAVFHKLVGRLDPPPLPA